MVVVVVNNYLKVPDSSLSQTAITILAVLVFFSLLGSDRISHLYPATR